MTKSHGWHKPYYNIEFLIYTSLLFGNYGHNHVGITRRYKTYFSVVILSFLKVRVSRIENRSWLRAKDIERFFRHTSCLHLTRTYTSHTHHLLSVIIYISTHWPSFRLSRRNFEGIVLMLSFCVCMCVGVLRSNILNYNIFYKIKHY